MARCHLFRYTHSLPLRKNEALPVTSRRQLLAATALGLAAPAALHAPLAQAQVFRSDLAPMPLPVKQDDTIAQGYRRDPLVRWGDRVAFDAPGWNPQGQDAEAAAGQFGWDARVVGLASAPTAADGVPRAVLAVVHQGVNPAMAFPRGGSGAVASAMQGASLLNVEKRGRWVVVDGGYQNRRLHRGTPVRISGPAADRAAGANGFSRGILAPQGGTVTPWGTLLLVEGNPAAATASLGAIDPGSENANQFGWLVELDPLDPRSVPVKRTALGRMNHGDVAATLSRDGRAVIYRVNRDGNGHLVRFISNAPATDADALDAGSLSVAVLDPQGRLSWVPVGSAESPPGAEQLLEINGVTKAAQPATQFPAPTGLALDPRKPRLLMVCRGGGRRPAGFVLEMTPDGGDDAAATASVATLFAAGDPGTVSAQYGRAGLPAGSAWLENPETVAIDTRGRAWIGTDRGGEPVAQANGLFVVDLEGPGRGVPLPMYGAPRGASVGGAALTPDGEVVFTAVRHPGAEPGASFARPGTRWPAFEAGVPPRTTLIGIERAAGGPVGG